MIDRILINEEQTKFNKIKDHEAKVNGKLINLNFFNDTKLKSY